MSATKPIRDPRATHARDPIIKAEFSYDARDETWAWNPVVRTELGYDYLSVEVQEPVTARIPDQIPGRKAVLEAVGTSIRRGTPFSLLNSVVDDAGVSHEVVVCGLPDINQDSMTVRGVVFEVTPPGDEAVPTLTRRLSRLPDGITSADLPWNSDEPLPAGLLATLNLCLDSSAPTCLIWGTERRLIYNQAYLEIVGPAHPTLFGAQLPKIWGEIWDAIADTVDETFRTGVPSTVTDAPFPIQRDGYTQDCFFTYTYIPIRDDAGEVSGLFIPIHETTGDVLRRRRLATLHDLATEGVTDVSPVELFTRLADVLAGNPDDIPFSLMYLIEPAARSATLQASTGLIQTADAAPEKLRLNDTSGWPIAEAIASRTPVLVDDVDRRFPGLLTGPESGTPRRALISYVDLDHERLPNAINILGVGGRQSLDAEYLAFLNRVARHLQTDLTAVATARLDRERSANLQRAMQSNRQIGAAIGILMTIHKVTEQQAFLLLSKASQQSNRKLREIADDVILAGTLPPDVLAAGQRKSGRRRPGEARQGEGD